MKRCKVEGCSRTVSAKGYCNLHYQRWRKYGDVTVVRPPGRPKSVVDWDEVKSLVSEGRILKDIAERFSIQRATLEALIGDRPSLAKELSQLRQEYRKAHPPAHGVSRYDGGCRCNVCQAANTSRYRQWKASRPATPPHRVHGTAGGYCNWDCRCDACRAAWNASMRNQRISRLSRTPPNRVHGTASGFNHWGCRCDGCREAIKDYRDKRANSIR